MCPIPEFLGHIVYFWLKNSGLTIKVLIEKKLSNKEISLSSGILLIKLNGEFL